MSLIFIKYSFLARYVIMSFNNQIQRKLFLVCQQYSAEYLATLRLQQWIKCRPPHCRKLCGQICQVQQVNMTAEG